MWNCAPGYFDASKFKVTVTLGWSKIRLVSNLNSEGHLSPEDIFLVLMYLIAYTLL